MHGELAPVGAHRGISTEQLAGLRLVTRADRYRRFAEISTAEKFGVPSAYRSTEEVLGHRVDLVSVYRPHPTHEDAVVAAEVAGVHVLCEKPISTDLVAAERMVRACEDAGVKLKVFFQRRFWPAAADAARPLRDHRHRKAAQRRPVQVALFR
ncbi:Gfo/Idh/MocA family oxidoreductase [Mycolicibacterium goodii]|uniref:Gfo/Idh/MocA family oxidoreductase n=1 Tax=Mycolicibacterium goodii TaxID=134601 RepID=UPI001F03EE12|nr:Gfo/Idh/MocA family oxidoreductase [Mycolicibacterium goodii]ULN45476.1 Gfo/Idh/MocA family oxidoreductase [Mycolicibacterium goodii]